MSSSAADRPAGPVLGPNAWLVGRPGSRHELGTPALLLDLDALEANLASLADHARRAGVALRPTAKVHKSVEIARRQVAAGALGVCVATLAEAEAMVDAGIAGVLLFSTVVTAAKLQRLAALNARAEGLVVATDGADNAAQLAAAARPTGRPLRVLVDVEVGGGRTGIADADAAVALARTIAGSEGLELAGLQAYVGDHQTIADYEQRRRTSAADLAPLGELVARLATEGLAPEIVSGGGTGTHDIDGALGLTELQPGTYALMDVNYRDVVMRPDEPHPFRAALSVRATVIGAAQPGFAITDAGTKEVDGMLGPLQPAILRGAPPGATYAIVGDDLGRIDLPADAPRPRIGDAVEIQPPHCYQTVAMYPVYHCVRGDDLVDIWPVDARDNL